MDNFCQVLRNSTIWGWELDWAWDWGWDWGWDWEEKMYKSFKEMPIWQVAMAVGEDVYKITTGLPKCEDYGFTSQIRRSTLSISANPM